jgi:lipoprotein-anchoring transpeptidase ErfK/SrfK
MAARVLSLAAMMFMALAAQAGAQTREVEVEIYYDRYGREVLVDVYTGEVVAVREPRGSIRDYRVERQRERWSDEPRGGEFPDETRREQRMEELGRGRYDERAPQYEEYPDEPEYDYGFEGEEAWPAQPQAQQPWRDAPTPSDRIDRTPLQQPSIAAVPEAVPNRAEQDAGISPPSDVIIEQVPPTTALPDVRQQPELGAIGATDDVAKIQILLDRLGASPGVIDGRIGDNVNKAIAAYRDLTGGAMRSYDAEWIEAQLQATGGDAFTSYEISPVDVAGRFVASVPTDYGEKAQMEHLSFTSVPEMLAERFHMDERYLRALNPGVSFDRPGTIIRVANVPRVARNAKVARIIADKSRRQVRTYDSGGKLLAVYPSTIGSAATPSPTGTHTVERVAIDPEYTYNPKVNFTQGTNTKVLRIPPGPNGPVGTVWIGLSKPTYGIHGTPDPSKIGKTESNGCIRLTNWDAQELAKMVQVGASVEFVE